MQAGPYRHGSTMTESELVDVVRKGFESGSIAAIYGQGETYRRVRDGLGHYAEYGALDSDIWPTFRIVAEVLARMSELIISGKQA